MCHAPIPRDDDVGALMLKALNKINLIFTQLKLCLATATHNFKLVKISYMGLIRDQLFANLDI